MKRKIFFPVLAIAIIGMALTGANFVSAQDINGQTSLITKIAQKFNLNEADVKAVFEEEKTARHAAMKAQMEEKLNQAIKDGKITEVQKQAILEKFGQPFTIKFEAKEMGKEDILKIKE